MGPLKKQKWEIFCQGVASGLTNEQAFINAGFSKVGASGASSRLNRDVRIQSRIAELKLQIVKQLEASVSPPNIQARIFVRQAVQDRAYRLAIIQDNVDRLRLVIDERAALYKDVPGGGASGLLVKTTRMIGSGAMSQRIDEYEVDRGPLSEMREYLKQAAIEVGDWEDKQAHRLVEPKEDLSNRTPEELFAEQIILNEAIAKIEALRDGHKPLEIAGSVSTVIEGDIDPVVIA